MAKARAQARYHKSTELGHGSPQPTAQPDPTYYFILQQNKKTLAAATSPFTSWSGVSADFPSEGMPANLSQQPSTTICVVRSTKNQTKRQQKGHNKRKPIKQNRDGTGATTKKGTDVRISASSHSHNNHFSFPILVESETQPHAVTNTTKLRDTQSLWHVAIRRRDGNLNLFLLIQPTTTAAITIHHRDPYLILCP